MSATASDVAELVNAARSLVFAMRDGAVHPRDYAAKRLAEALAPFPADPNPEEISHG